jgi:hypothetical protein
MADDEQNNIVHLGTRLPPHHETDGGGPHDPGMEARIAKLEADVSHIQRDVSDIKASLAQIVPVVNRVDGFLQAKLPHLATKEDMEKRPTWARITATVGFVALVASLPFWHQWKALFQAAFSN